MSWIALFEACFRVRPWTFPVLGLLFLVPIVRLLTLPFACGHPAFMRINRRFGQWEHLVFLPRDTLVALWLAGFSFWHLYLAAMLESQTEALAALVGALLLGAGWLQRNRRRRDHLALLAFARKHPTVHPQEFFDHLLCTSGILRHSLPAAPRATVDPKRLSFSKGAGPRWVPIRNLAAGFWSTFWCAHLLLGESRAGVTALKESGSALGLIWAARVAQLSRSDVTVEGWEQLPPEGSPQIFFFNHLSSLDSVYASLALAARPGASPERLPGRCMPSFLLAKDHFRDNFFYYRILGMGRFAELVGMTFIDRSGGSAERARVTARIASEKLLSEELPLAIYPQGTRAAPYVGMHGERLDGAYYTVGSRSRIEADGAHLKKGAAFIAAETAMALARRGSAQPVHLIPVAILGTGIAAPRNTLRILGGVPIRLIVGEPIVITPADVATIAALEDAAAPEKLFPFVNDLHRRIDLALKTTLRIHASLERRFFEEIRGILTPSEQEEVALAMKPWRGDDFLVHAILDAIYASAPSQRRALINELAQLLLQFATREDLLAFKGRVAHALKA